MAEPTSEQRKAIRAFIDGTLLPLIGGVLEKKLTQAALFMRDELMQPAEPDCWAILTPNGSRLVSPEEAKGALGAYPLYRHAPAAGVTACPPADEAPLFRCSSCGRKSWDEGERDKFCDMPQPNGERCNGRLRAHGVATVAPADIYEQRLRDVLDVVQRYLPPDGIAVDLAMSEITALVDPWPAGVEGRKP